MKTDLTYLLRTDNREITCIDEAYCDYDDYENLIDNGVIGEQLFDEMLSL